MPETQDWAELKVDVEFQRNYVGGPHARGIVGEYDAWYPDLGQYRRDAEPISAPGSGI